MNVKLTQSQKIKILNSEDLYSVMQRILLRENKIDRSKEHFWIIGLAQNSKILYIELISLGTIKATLVEPMEIFSLALQKRTVHIILVHNHPSGEITPSEADKDLTDRLLQIGRFLNIPVTDHLIITEKTFYSFTDSGLLEQLSQSRKYRLPYQELERIKKEAEQTGKEKRNKEIARALKSKKIPPETIASVTGLSKEEIKALKNTRGNAK